jgi:hypothetical protein
MKSPTLHPNLRHLNPLQNLTLLVGYILILSFHHLIGFIGGVFSLGVPAKLVFEFAMTDTYQSHIRCLI